MKTEFVAKWQSILDEADPRGPWDEESHWAQLMNTPANQSLGVFHTLPSYEKYCQSMERGMIGETLHCYQCETDHTVEREIQPRQTDFDPTTAYLLDCGHVVI